MTEGIGLVCLFSNKLFAIGVGVEIKLTLGIICFFNELLVRTCCWGCDIAESVLCFCIGARILFTVVDAAANFISLDGGFNFDLYFSVDSFG